MPPKGRAAPKPKAKGRPKPAPPAKEQHAFLNKAKEYDWDACKALLEEKPELVNVRPAGRWSALHQFASADNAEAVTELLKLGADREAKTKDGETAEDVATGDCKELIANYEPPAEEEEAAEEEPPPPEEPAPPKRKPPPAKAAEEKAEEEEAAPAKRKPPPAAKAAEETPAEEEEAAPAKRKPPPAAKAGAASSSSSSSTAPAPGKRKAPDSAAAPASPAKKAKRPVDSSVPAKDSYEVVDDWSVLLNQTNVGANNNKFYKIQVLEKEGDYFCWTRWGRVGASGQFKLSPCGSDQGRAEKEAKQKFKEKTGVLYDLKDTTDWTPKVGKYTLVLTDDQEGADGGDAPLGKLTPAQIEKGQGVLEKLDAELEKKGKKDVTALQNLSSQYYTLIPHNFGFSVPPTINTKDMLEAEEELLKFYLRMGFEEVDKADDGLTPVSGVMELALPATLSAAASKICSGSQVTASTKKGEEHAAKQSGKPAKKMEPHLYAAIMLYTSNAIYAELNKVLRSEDRTKIKKFFPYLRLLLEALGRLPQQNKELYRGVSVDLFDDYKESSTITWWGVSSCTSDIGVANGFMKGCGGSCTLLRVKAKTAADISAITFFGNEKEHLLAPGTQLKVLSRKKEGKQTEIVVQEVGRVLQ